MTKISVEFLRWGMTLIIFKTANLGYIYIQNSINTDVMSNEIMKSDSNKLNNGPWDELYALTEHWKSDLEFYKDDLRFLHHLVEKYFIWITKSENLYLVKELKISLFQLSKKCEDLLKKVGKHRIKLGYLFENPNNGDASITKMEHEHLEEEMERFVKLFRMNRKEVFKITEYIIDSESLVDKIDS